MTDKHHEVEFYAGDVDRQHKEHASPQEKHLASQQDKEYASQQDKHLASQQDKEYASQYYTDKHREVKLHADNVVAPALEVRSENPDDGQNKGDIEVPVDSTVFAGFSKDALHLQDDSKPGKFGWVEKIWIPVVVAAVSLFATGVGTFLGFQFRNLQLDRADIERIITRASQASSERQAVLTSYAGRITDLMTEKSLAKPTDKELIREAIRGESIIALKRLDDTRDTQNGLGEIDLLKEQMPESSKRNSNQGSSSQALANSQNNQIEDLKGFDDSGKLKGELVRFLYEADLLGDVNANLKVEGGVEKSLLRGADLTRVVLSDAPLGGINLRRAWIPWGQLDNAILRNSDLRGTQLSNANLSYSDLEKANLNSADLSSADLRRTNLRAAILQDANLQKADLRGTDLREVDLAKAKTLTGACYNRLTTKGLDGVDPDSLGMRDTTGETLDVACSQLPYEAL